MILGRERLNSWWLNCIDLPDGQPLGVGGGGAIGALKVGGEDGMEDDHKDEGDDRPNAPV